MRKRSMGLAVLAVTILATPQALAFGTIRGLGQNAEHERITRRGLAGFGFGPASLDALAGRKGTFGAVGAPDHPLRGLMGSKAAHCDGGDWFDAPGYAQDRAGAQAALTACRDYVMANIDAAVTDAGGLVRADLGLAGDASLDRCAFNGRKGRAKCDVLEDMGMAFHAAQDFYAHSNWVDASRAHPTIADPQGLDRAAPAPWLSPAGAPFPDGLISGCYDGFPEALHCGGRIRHAALNKDTAGSARGRAAYDRAMAVAVQDTRARWASFESRLIARYGALRGTRMICVLKSDAPGRC